MEQTFTEQIETINFKLQQAFDASDYSQNVTLTCKEAIALKCYLDTIKGQNSRLFEENTNLEEQIMELQKLR